MRTTMTVYVTQYALTKGIFTRKVETTNFPDLVVDTNEARVSYSKPYWHESEAEALEHAETMRQKKICSLKNQLAKMEALSFEPKGEQDAF